MEARESYWGSRYAAKLRSEVFRKRNEYRREQPISGKQDDLQQLGNLEHLKAGNSDIA